MDKKLSKIDVFSIVLGSIIGWGSFMLPGSKFLIEAGVINTTIALFIGALFIIVIQSSYYVMLSDHDEEGGEFSFTYKHMGKVNGFIVGWFLLLAYLTIIPLNGTAFPLVIRKIFGDFFQFGYLYSIAGFDIFLGEIILSNLVILLFAYINIRGIKDSARVQNFIAITLVSLVFVVFTIVFINADKVRFAENYINNYQFDLSQVLRIFAITPFAFVGFDNIPQICKEYEFGPRTASLIAIIAVLIGATIYSVLNLTAGLIFSPAEAYAQDWALGTGVLMTIGRFGFVLLVIALAAAVTSGINGFMISTSKLMGSISNHGMVPSRYSFVNKNGVFSNSIIFATIISLIAPWFGREVILWIVDMSSLGAAIAYFFVCFIAFRITKSQIQKFLSGLGVAASAMTVLLLLLPASPAALGRESLIALGLWIILGGTFYWTIVSSRKKAGEKL